MESKICIHWIYIHTAYGGDHRKGKFRFASKLLVRLVDGTKHKLIYPLADILCCNDSGKLLKNTIVPNLGDGINKV